MDLATPYRLLYFRASQLERWEAVQASSDMDAVQKAAKRPSDDLVELWAADRKIAALGPVGSHPKR